MSTILGWIFWTIGVIGIYLGIYFVWTESCRNNHRKILIGWALMIIGLMFNSIAALIDSKWFAFVLSIAVILLDYQAYKAKKKEFDLEDDNIRELFLKEIAEHKLGRKNA